MSTQKSAREDAQKYVALNRKARHDYAIDETFEAGLVLTGTEVKSLRQGNASLTEAHAGLKQGRIYLFNLHVPAYGKAGVHLQHDEKRPRLLLLQKRQINKLIGGIQREGYTLVPMALYFNARGLLKLQLGLAKGKKKADKREAAKERDWQRDKARLMKSRKG
ncbi:MAG: SsrA-binding protein SmpB [Alphaproteobacteria bacterium]|nr:SsrA-binding protein SmpB [Alphaproteobacteria bacterium]NDG04577.1 SsrA-binding protein SmpB [Alphaproteobacteria bacterium]